MNTRARDVPELVAGDRLTRDEFERRYAAMPSLKKAELIEGVVFVPSPVIHVRHGGPHARIVTWICNYADDTPGADCGDNSTVRLDLDNEPQPDVLLRIESECGGRSTIGPDDYVEGSPELVVEVAASSASYDLHDKLHVYRRNGVQEYLVWRVDNGALDWFRLRAGRYEPLSPGSEGILRSEVFPGLWLDGRALLRGDGRQVRDVLQGGVTTSEHAAFVAELEARRR